MAEAGRVKEGCEHEIPERETIVEIGGEGGSIKLLRVRKKNQAWGYVVLTDESTLASLMDEEELRGVELVREGPVQDTLEAAILSLDRYPWVQLYSLYVKQEFRETIRHEVEARLRPDDEHKRERWEKVFQGRSRSGRGDIQ